MSSYQVFIPPSRHNVPPVGADTPKEDYAPAIYFNDPIPAGENVFVTTAGVVTERQPQTWELVKTVYWGGHITIVDSTEVALLTAAGYAANIQTVTTGNPSLPVPPPPVIPPSAPSGWGTGGWGTEGWGQ